MPIARIQLDDGRIARIEVPEGTTPEQAMAFAQSQAKPSRQEAAKAERSGMARGLGLGVRNVAEGIGNLAGIVANPAIATINAMGGNLPEYSTALSRTLTAAGLPEPETEGERVMGRVQREVAGVIPTMGAGLAMSGLRGAAGGVGRALAEKPLIQAAGAAGSGLSAQMAQEAGAGPVGETLASLGGAIGATGLAEGAAAMGRAGSAMLEPFKQAGRERIAADVLLRSSADPENLGSRIAAGLDDPMRRLPESPVTTAQAARDPGLMVMEQGLRSDAGRSAGQGGMSGAVAFRDVEAARNAARERAFAGMSDDISPDIRGGQVREVISQQEQAAMPGGPLSHILGRIKDATPENSGFYGTLDELAKERSASAAPLYEKAFSSKGVHSDRIVQFLNDPITREGMKRGLEIQRLEALAQGKPFTPSDYAITGFNDAGDPIISAVPNMRLLDATKRGLDEILEGYRDTTTGRLVLDQRGRAIDGVRKAFLTTLDNLNPDYKAARKAWAGPSESMNALSAGRDALTKDPEIIVKQLSNMGDADRDFYRAGVFRALQDKFSGIKNTDVAYSFINNSSNRDRLAAVFGRDMLSSIMSQVREQAVNFGRDESGASAVGRILKKNPYGAPIMPDARVASEILANPQNLNQTLKAAGKRADEVKAVLRGQFIDNLMQATRTSGVVADAAGNVSNVLSPAQFKRFFDKNATVAKQIFDKPGQFMALQRLANDFAETAMVSTTGRARGSDTAQNLSVGNLIARASNGLIDPSSPIAQTLVGIGPIGRLLYTAPEAATRELLIEAARDPKFARILLEKAGPDGVKRAAAYLNGSAGDRIRQALSDASVRLQAQSAVSQQNEGPY